MEQYSTGIALSGGGARGFAHLGIMKALHEKGIYPEIISGVSAGAIAGVFLAAGYAPEEVSELLNKNGFFRFSKIQIPKTGLLNLVGLKEILNKNIKAKNIEDLKQPLFVGVSNLTEGKMEYLDKGPLGEAVLASCSIPILFSPVKIGNSLYVDGGLFDNLPVKPLKARCKYIIAANISPLHRNVEMENLIQVASRIFHLSIGSKTEDKKSQCNLYIEPAGIAEFQTLVTGHDGELFDLGYKFTRELAISPDK